MGHRKDRYTGTGTMMNKTGKILLISVLMLTVAGLFACGEKTPPAPKPQVVKRKIGGQINTPPNAQTAAVKPLATPKTASPRNAPAAQEKTEPASEAKPETSDLVKESMAFAGHYDATGRFDPFEPLFKSEPTEQAAAARKRKKRVPQTPLERVAITQLKLTAIMQMAKGNRAIVEDATGKGYVIHKGTYIGLNAGQVLSIDKDHVMIEEEVEDVSGEFRIRKIELKLQKPAGEL